MKSSKESIIEKMQAEMTRLAQNIKDINRMEQGEFCKLHLNLNGSIREAIVAPAYFNLKSIKVFILASMPIIVGDKRGMDLFSYDDIMGVEPFDKKDAALLINYHITDYGKSFLFNN